MTESRDLHGNGPMSLSLCFQCEPPHPSPSSLPCCHRDHTLHRSMEQDERTRLPARETNTSQHDQSQERQPSSKLLMESLSCDEELATCCQHALQLIIAGNQNQLQKLLHAGCCQGTVNTCGNKKQSGMLDIPVDLAPPPTLLNTYSSHR